ncbi:MAG: hypothetical protein M1824_000983 [Vezdaea acicularis]|nr:MAG: hypothetical protein M1824_000983 [Vezdaea acicularis]
MQPQTSLTSKALPLRPVTRLKPVRSRRRLYATVTATTPAAHRSGVHPAVVPIQRFPPTQPPSHKPPELRKSQLFRQYASLLRSTPIMLLFQHNNLKSTEWMSIRRELASALQKASASLPTPETAIPIDAIKVQTIQTGIFAAALKVVENYDPLATPAASPDPSAPSPPSSTTSTTPNTSPNPLDQTYTHLLSRTAHAAATSRKPTSALIPLLSGPLAIATIPTLSPHHLTTTLRILSPSPPLFPAPTRRSTPSYHDPSVQNGLQKLLLLGARIDGRVFDADGARWVASIDGGLDGLRAQLVHALQGMGAGLSGLLEGGGRSLYLALEARRGMLSEQAQVKGGDAPAGPAGGA